MSVNDSIGSRLKDWNRFSETKVLDENDSILLWYYYNLQQAKGEL